MYLISQTIKLNKPKVKALTSNTFSINIPQMTAIWTFKDKREIHRQSL